MQRFYCKYKFSTYHFRNKLKQKNEELQSPISLNEIDALPQILEKLPKADDRTKEDYCKQIIRMLKEPNEELWHRHFVKTLFASLEILFDKNENVRHDALLMLKLMAQNHISLFSDFVEIALKRILEKFGDSSKDVQIAAEDAAFTFIEKIDSIKMLEILRPMIINPSGKDSILLGGIRILSKLIHKIPETNLLQQIPSILPSLFDVCNFYTKNLHFLGF